MGWVEQRRQKGAKGEEKEKVSTRVRACACVPRKRISSPRPGPRGAGLRLGDRSDQRARGSGYGGSVFFCFFFDRLTRKAAGSSALAFTTAFAASSNIFCSSCFSQYSFTHCGAMMPASRSLAPNLLGRSTFGLDLFCPHQSVFRAGSLFSNGSKFSSNWKNEEGGRGRGQARRRDQNNGDLPSDHDADVLVVQPLFRKVENVRGRMSNARKIKTFAGQPSRVTRGRPRG